MSRIYIDMDEVMSNYSKLFQAEFSDENKYPQSRKGFFAELEPIEGAIESVKHLIDEFDVWILTAPSYMNPHCYTDKRVWIEKYFGLEFCKKLIIAYDKSLLIGDFLIDDSIKNNQSKFNGELIPFGQEHYSNWVEVLRYLDSLRLKE